jgi:hypothetical protein
MIKSTSFGRESAALLVERLTKVYADGTRALEDLELRIPSGCFFALLGPNGGNRNSSICRWPPACRGVRLGALSRADDQEQDCQRDEEGHEASTDQDQKPAEWHYAHGQQTFFS